VNYCILVETNCSQTIIVAPLTDGSSQITSKLAIGGSETTPLTKGVVLASRSGSGGVEGGHMPTLNS
jgi:hypothetical protein